MNENFGNFDTPKVLPIHTLRQSQLVIRNNYKLSSFVVSDHELHHIP